MVTRQQTRPDDDVNQIAEFVRGLPRRQLVVLGAPGSGKSVLALLLARDLARDLGSGEPVPVLLPLSSWRPEIGLRAWMAERILALCPDLAADHGSGMALRLIGQGRIMPVLDGLDELPASLRARAIEAIDTDVADGVPLLVTCRGTEYERTVLASGQYLTRAAVVELEPVAADIAEAFLRASSPPQNDRWRPVCERLQREPDSPLRHALSNPLMLYLARTAYRAEGKDPGELLDETEFGTAEAIESHLLKIYIPTVYAENARRRYGPRQAGRWLEFIARQMHERDTVDFTWRQVFFPFILSPFLLACGGAFCWFFSMLFGRDAGLLSLVPAGVVITIAAFHGPWWDGSGSSGDPRSALRRLAIVTLGASALGAVSVSVSVTFWLHAMVRVPLGAAVYPGIVAGLGFGGTILLGSNWGSYMVSHGWYGLTRRLPWRLWTFVEDAHRLGVLRMGGSAYRFRHVRLMEQLSGATRSSEQPDDSDADGTTRRRPWADMVFPTMELLFFIGLLIIVVVAPAIMMVMPGGFSDLEYRSGDRPAAVSGTMCDPDRKPGDHPICTDHSVITWTLPARSATHTTFGPSHRIGNMHMPVRALSGKLRASGCTGASVQVTMVVTGVRLPPFVMGAGEKISLGDRARLPEHAPDAGPVEITLRRLDQRPCALQLVWARFGTIPDLYEHIRRRLS
ncbi:NACHT domain-containing protein [Actinoallomurus liliacearum]|uniref:NACHT domain-containing protein n=1 Tax=Actinoallomurus liliacearum TaxID=1080073 RepID=UPI0031E61003